MKILSVCVARSEIRLIQGQAVPSAIGKRAVAGPVAVHALGLAGDEQADPTVHGGLSKAIYAYPVAHYPFWQGVRAQARVAAQDALLPHGFMGENLTIDGLLEEKLWIGDQLRLPGCVLAVSEPRQPCFKFNDVMGFNQASKLMAWLKPITSLNLKQGWRGSLTASTQPGRRNRSPIQSFSSNRPSMVRFSPMKPCGNAASTAATRACARTPCQNG